MTKPEPRCFDANGGHANLQTTDHRQRRTEPEEQLGHALASKINAEQSQIVRGQQRYGRPVQPVYGQNRSTSGWQPATGRISLSSPPVEEQDQRERSGERLPLDSSKLTLTFLRHGPGDLAITNTLYDHGGVARGQSSADIRTAARVSPWR